jgi:hypothetical protein
LLRAGRCSSNIRVRVRFSVKAMARVKRRVMSYATYWFRTKVWLGKG